MEKYFRMVTHFEHHWGIYLAGAWLLGPTLLVYLSDGFWMACAIFLYWRIACTRFSKRWNCVLDSFLCLWDEFPSDWLIFGVPVEPQPPVTNLDWKTHVGFTLGSLKLISAVDSLQPHGRVTFWFTLAATAPRPVSVLFCILLFSRHPKT